MMSNVSSIAAIPIWEQKGDLRQEPYYVVDKKAVEFRVIVFLFEVEEDAFRRHEAVLIGHGSAADQGK